MKLIKQKKNPSGMVTCCRSEGDFGVEGGHALQSDGEDDVLVRRTATVELQRVDPCRRVGDPPR